MLGSKGYRDLLPLGERWIAYDEVRSETPRELQRPLRRNGAESQTLYRHTCDIAYPKAARIPDESFNFGTACMYPS